MPFSMHIVCLSGIAQGCNSAKVEHKLKRMIICKQMMQQPKPPTVCMAVPGPVAYFDLIPLPDPAYGLYGRGPRPVAGAASCKALSTLSPRAIPKSKLARLQVENWHDSKPA